MTTTSKDPVIILTTPRSYSTLVCSMLGQHPQMYGLPETHLFVYKTVEEWWTDKQNVSVHGLLRAVSEVVFGGQTQAKVERAQSWLRRRRRWSTEDVVRALGERVHPRTLIEKTPMTSAKTEYMERILQTYPEAKLLYLVRHPVGNVQSWLKRIVARLGGPRGLISERLVMRRLGTPIEVRWHRRNLRILNFLEKVPRAQQLILRAEDLLADPDARLREAAGWLGVRSDDEAVEAMKHPETSPFAKFGPPGARFGGDPNFLREPALRPPKPLTQTLDDPVPWRNGRGLADDVKELAKRLGYS